MRLFSEVWATKHLSHFQGTNHQLSRISSLVKNVCPSCGCQDEAMSHITQCRNPGRSCVFTNSVDQLVQWLGDQQMDSKIIHLFKRYLLARGTRTLPSLLQPGSQLGVEARFHDRLGWGCFLEGQPFALWVEHRARHIKRANLTDSANFWARGLMRRLLQMTHAQRSYRNATVHLEVKEGWTVTAHEKILGQWKASSALILNNFLKSIVTYSSRILLHLHQVLLKIN